MYGTRDDRILYWPAVLAIAWPLFFIFVCFLASALTWTAPIVLLFVPVELLVLTLWGASGLFACMLSLQWGYQRAWRRLLSTMVLALSVAAAALNLDFVWRAGPRAGDYVHLFLLYPVYASQIAEEPAGEPRFVVWEWGGFLSRGRGVAYDESDEIASDHPSQAWMEKADQRGIIGYGYTRALGHFYFVDFH